jgi:hypothetical protein
MRRFSVLVILIVCMPSLAAAVLSVHPKNPRYFADERGRAIYLGGHQVFVDLQDNSFNKEFIKRYEKAKPKQHLVLMSAGGRTRTGGWKQMGRDPVVNSPADCFAAAGSWQAGRYKKKDPPANDSGKPGIVDTDHGAAGSSDVGYVWTAFTRGYHFNLYDKPFENPDAEGPEWRRVRSNAGKTVEYANKLDLANVTPRDDLASTGFCLAKPGFQYVVYQPGDGPITVSDLRAGASYYFELYDTGQSKVVTSGRIQASGSTESFKSKYKGLVLYLNLSGSGESYP